MSLDKVLSKIDADLPDATERLLELLRIPSISTDPALQIIAKQQQIGWSRTFKALVSQPQNAKHPAIQWWSGM